MGIESLKTGPGNNQNESPQLRTAPRPEEEAPRYLLWNSRVDQGINERNRNNHARRGIY